MTLYDEYMEAFRSANAGRNKENRLIDGRKVWNDLKADPEAVKLKIIELKKMASE